MPTTPTIDPLAEFDFICEFPLATGAFTELRRYVRHIHEFLPHASAQQAIRLEARLQNEADPVAIGEIDYELERINIDSQVSLPRLIWGGTLVTIFGAYENSVTNAVRYWQMITKHQNEFAKVGKRDVLKTVSQYSQSNIGVALFQTQQLEQAITELKCFRRSFAHGSGLLLKKSCSQISCAVPSGTWGRPVSIARSGHE